MNCFSKAKNAGKAPNVMKNGQMSNLLSKLKNEKKNDIETFANAQIMEGTG